MEINQEQVDDISQEYRNKQTGRYYTAKVFLLEVTFIF